MMNIDSESKLENFFTRNEWIFFFAIIIVGILLRWLNLDVRAFHHDESLHAIYGKYTYNAPVSGYYKYQALLHGPFMYNNILPHIYNMIGLSKWSARCSMAFIGSLFLFIPILFRSFFSKRSVLILTTFLALSPSLVYWSRFLRHDPFVLFFWLTAFISYVYVPPKFKSIPILISLTLPFTIKENAYMTVSMLLGYILFEIAVNKFMNIKTPSLISKCINNIKTHYVSFIFGLLISAFLYCYIFSVGFKHIPGIIDGIYRKSLSYWIHQHSIERIKGPFSYQFFMLCFYDFAFIATFIIHLLHFYIKESKEYIIALAIPLSFALIAFIYYSINYPISPESVTNPFWIFFKFKIPLDFIIAIILMFHSVILTFYHLSRDEKILSFFSYAFLASFFSYSYVGEKVPWLSQYPLILGFIYLVMYYENKGIISNLFKNYFPYTKIKYIYIIAPIVIIFTLKISLITNFSRAGDKRELISQVHTEKNYENIVLKIKEDITNSLANQNKTALTHNHAWPATWFMFGLPNYSFRVGTKKFESFDYIIAENLTSLEKTSLKKTHYSKVIPFRSWWVPDYRKMNPLKFFNYVFNHTPWGPSGSSNATIYYKK